jgi:hypothetical protein
VARFGAAIPGFGQAGIGVPLPESSGYLEIYFCVRPERRPDGSGLTRRARLPARGGDAIVEGDECLN